jgi:hypothetical protein
MCASLYSDAFRQSHTGKVGYATTKNPVQNNFTQFRQEKDVDYFRDHGHDKDFVRKCSARCVNVPKELQRLLQESQVTDSARDDLQGTTTSNDQNHPFWAVAVGRIPGIYMDNLDTLIQVDQFSGHQIGSFATLAGGSYLPAYTRPTRSQHALIRETFTKTVDFKPDPRATFNDELRRWMRSMKSSQKVERMARFRAFHDELIYNYLPEGVFVHQVVEGNGVMELNTNQTLQIMQAMCRDSRRQAGNGVFDCVAELKCAPYFRIFDVVNAVRMGTPVPTFDN